MDIAVECILFFYYIEIIILKYSNQTCKNLIGLHNLHPTVYVLLSTGSCLHGDFELPHFLYLPLDLVRPAPLVTDVIAIIY
jgi:hypothetical protein